METIKLGFLNIYYFNIEYALKIISPNLCYSKMPICPPGRAYSFNHLCPAFFIHENIIRHKTTQEFLSSVSMFSHPYSKEALTKIPVVAYPLKLSSENSCSVSLVLIFHLEKVNEVAAWSSFFED